MRKTFTETGAFSARVQEFLDDDAYAALQWLLMERPDSGSVIPGCAGIRKIRIGDPRRRKGKRGGARIIYLHGPEADKIFFLRIYGKNERDDLDAAEKKRLRQLAEAFRQQAVQSAQSQKKEDIK